MQLVHVPTLGEESKASASSNVINASIYVFLLRLVQFSPFFWITIRWSLLLLKFHCQQPKDLDDGIIFPFSPFSEVAHTIHAQAAVATCASFAIKESSWHTVALYPLQG